MKQIICIEKYKGKTFEISFLDGEKAYINYDIITEYNLKDNTTVPDSAWDEIIYANNLRKAKERALYLLDSRDYSYTELFKKLEANYSDDVCFSVMSKMVELGVINDKRYAQTLSRYLIETKKFGYYRAVSEMRLKGLSKEIIQEVLEPYEENAYDRLYELVVKKYSLKLTDENGIKKVKNALARQGYSYDQINAVLDDYLYQD